MGIYRLQIHCATSILQDQPHSHRFCIHNLHKLLLALLHFHDEGKEGPCTVNVIVLGPKKEQWQSKSPVCEDVMKKVAIELKLCVIIIFSRHSKCNRVCAKLKGYASCRGEPPDKEKSGLVWQWVKLAGHHHVCQCCFQEACESWHCTQYASQAFQVPKGSPTEVPGVLQPSTIRNRMHYASDYQQSHVLQHDCCPVKDEADIPY